MKQLLEARSDCHRPSEPLITVPLGKTGAMAEHVGGDVLRASSIQYEVILHGVLYDRDELYREIGSPEPHRPSDAALVLGAVTRWGLDAPQRLRGDFFYVVRDRLGGSTTLVRDPSKFTPAFMRRRRRSC